MTITELTNDADALVGALAQLEGKTPKTRTPATPAARVTVRPVEVPLSSPEVRGAVEALKREAAALGYDIRLTSGDRSRAKQEALYANRGANPYPVAKPGTSRHERGLAVDLNVYQGKRRVSPGVLAEVASRHGLHWLGERDEVHFDYRPAKATGAAPSTQPQAAATSEADSLVRALAELEGKVKPRKGAAPVATPQPAAASTAPLVQRGSRPGGPHLAEVDRDLTALFQQGQAPGAKPAPATPAPKAPSGVRLINPWDAGAFDPNRWGQVRRDNLGERIGKGFAGLFAGQAVEEQRKQIGEWRSMIAQKGGVPAFSPAIQQALPAYQSYYEKAIAPLERRMHEAENFVNTPGGPSLAPTGPTAAEYTRRTADIRARAAKAIAARLNPEAVLKAVDPQGKLSAEQRAGILTAASWHAWQAGNYRGLSDAAARDVLINTSSLIAGFGGEALMGGVLGAVAKTKLGQAVAVRGAQSFGALPPGAQKALSGPLPRGVVRVANPKQVAGNYAGGMGASASDDALNRRPIDLRRANQAGLQGAAFGIGINGLVELPGAVRGTANAVSNAVSKVRQAAQVRRSAPVAEELVTLADAPSMGPVRVVKRVGAKVWWERPGTPLKGTVDAGRVQPVEAAPPATPAATQPAAAARPRGVINRTAKPVAATPTATAARPRRVVTQTAKPVQPTAQPQATPRPATAPVATPEAKAPAPSTRVAQVPLSQIEADPARFQYKISGVGADGVTGEMKGISKWDPNKAGVILVWKDPANGRTFVVNGHHRYDLAKRLNVPSLDVRFIDAATDAEARHIGAAANIAEGRGTAVDAAKLFRERGATPKELAEDGISLKGKVANDGMALAALDEGIWRKVTVGQFPESRAIAIGRALPDPAEQRALVGLLEAAESRGKRLSDAEITELARQVKAAPTVQTSGGMSLFGEEDIIQNLAIEKAQLGAWVKGQLSKDQRLFGYVSKGARADELTRGGNKIDVAQSREIADAAGQTLELFDRLSTRSGPISDALNDAAKRLAAGENVNVIRTDLYRAVSDGVRAELGGHPNAGNRGRAAGDQSARVPGTAATDRGGNRGAAGAGVASEPATPTPATSAPSTPIQAAAKPQAAKPTAAPTPDRRPLTRNFRAGTNNGQVTFRDHVQMDLYDLGSRLRRRNLGGQDKASQAPLGDIDGLRTRLAQALGVDESTVTRLASETHVDVKAQLQGIKDGEGRAVVDNVRQVAESKPATPSASTATPSTPKPQQAPSTTGLTEAFSDVRLTDSFVDDAWSRVQKGKRLNFSDKAGTVEAKIQAAADAGRIKNREDVARIVQEHYAPQGGKGTATPPKPRAATTQDPSQPSGATPAARKAQAALRKAEALDDFQAAAADLRDALTDTPLASGGGAFQGAFSEKALKAGVRMVRHLREAGAATWDEIGAALEAHLGRRAPGFVAAVREFFERENGPLPSAEVGYGFKVGDRVIARTPSGDLISGEVVGKSSGGRAKVRGVDGVERYVSPRALQAEGAAPAPAYQPVTLPKNPIIEEMVEYVRTDRSGTYRVETYAKVTPEEAARLKEATGLDLKGYSHVVDDKMIRHVIKEHGKGEVRAGQVPLDVDDLARIAEVTTNPDYVRLSNRKTDRGLTAIEYEKRADGYVFVVEAVRTRQKQLALQSAHKVGGPGGLRAIPDGVGSRAAFTSETYSGNLAPSVADSGAPFKPTARAQAALKRAEAVQEFKTAAADLRDALTDTPLSSGAGGLQGAFKPEAVDAGVRMAKALVKAGAATADELAAALQEHLGRPAPQLIRAIVDEYETRHGKLKSAAKDADALSPTYAGSVNLDRLDASPEVKSLIREAVEANRPAVDAQRRGVRSQESTAREADELIRSGVVTPETLKGLKAGKSLNAEELQAAAVLHVRMADEVRAAEAAWRENDSSENLARLTEATASYQAVMLALEGATTEAGRALNIMRRVKEAYSGVVGTPAELVEQVMLPSKAPTVRKGGQRVAVTPDMPEFGTTNRLFTRNAAEAARQRLRAKAGRLNSGLPVDMLPDLLEVGGYYVEGGLRAFAPWSQRMMNEFGLTQAQARELWSRVRPEVQSRAAKVARPKDTARDQLRKILGDEGLSAEVLADLAKIPEGDVVGLSKLLRSQMRMTPREVFHAYRKSSLTSGTGTHFRNFVSTALNLPLRSATKASASAWDAAVDLAAKVPVLKEWSKLKSLAEQDRTHYLVEAFPNMAATRVGFREGVRDFAEMVGNGITSDVAARMELPMKELPTKGAFGMVNRGLNLNFRIQGATDAFNHRIFFQQARHAGAVRQALNEGVKGKAVAARVEELLDDPKIVAAAREEADYWTFHQEPNASMRSFNNWRRDTAGMEFVIPFYTTPANVLRQTIRYVPGANVPGVYAAWRSGNRRLIAERMGEATTGGLIVGGISALLKPDDITGAPPQKDAERSAFYANGKQPYSVRIGGQWFNYQGLGVWTTLFTAVAASRAQRWGESAEMPAHVGRVLLSVGQSFKDQSALTGLADVLELIDSDSVRKWERAVGGSLGSLIPFSGALRSAGRATDPLQRAPESIADFAMRDMPVVGQRLPARVSPLGEPQRRVPGGAAALQPFWAGTDRNDPVAKELGRLELFPGKVSPKLRDGGAEIRLTSAQQRELQQTRGQAIRKELSRLFQSADYRESGEEDRKRQAEQVIRDLTATVGGLYRKHLRDGGKQPFTLEGAAQDPITRELLAHRISLSPVGSSLKVGTAQVRLTPDQRKEYQRLTDAAIKEQVGAVLARPGWKDLTEAQRERTLERLVARARVIGATRTRALIVSGR